MALWSWLTDHLYAGKMPLAPKPTRTLHTIRAPEGLSDHEGEWVAIKGGEIIASAPTARELALKMREMGERARGASAQFVSPPVEGYRVGVG
jgi:uncharacterized protein DUF5678